MYKITFLILNYRNFVETKKSVSSIFENVKYDNYNIVIVDNASKDGSIEKLEKLYKDNSNIYFVYSHKNLGFANGNNLGFEYIKNKLKSDFIVMMNNDVYMIQSDFCNKIIEEYEKSNFAVLGPRIIMRDNKICDYSDKLPQLNYLIKTRILKKIYYYLNKMYLRYIYSFFSKLSKIFRKKDFIDTSIRKENVVLNGCCLIFSSKYISKFDGIDDRTFMYYEEPLLYIRVCQNKLKSVYNPYLIVYHNETSSINKVSTNKRKKFDFVLKNEINSLNVLIEEMKKTNL